MDENVDTKKIEKALDIAHDIRKFEIELYWKRATYFWAFIASAYAAYIAVFANIHNINCCWCIHCMTVTCNCDSYYLLLLISAIGFLLSLAWFFVNKGSKFWQRNWEEIIYLLEYDVSGNILKYYVNDNDDNCIYPSKPYKYSVSKVNQIVSFYITLSWILFMAYPVWKVWNICYIQGLIVSVVAIILVVWATLNMYCKCKSHDKKSDKLQNEDKWPQGYYNRNDLLTSIFTNDTNNIK